MKLSLDLPLDADREKALAEIDRRIGLLLAERSALNLVYTQKYALAASILAKREEPPAWLVAEASSKGLGIEDLCNSIVEKFTTERGVVFSYEGLRQTLKAQVRSATNQQDITNAVLQAGGSL